MGIIKRSSDRISKTLLKTDTLNSNTLILLAVFTTLCSINSFFINGVGHDVDSSWVQALNLTYKEKLVYGRDVVFTFGPLGYIITGFLDYVPKWPTILINLLILFAGCHFIYLIISKLKNKVLIGVFLLSIILFEFSIFHIEATTALFFAVFYSIYFVDGQKKIFGLIPGFVCGVALFLKLNAGIAAGVYLIIYSLFLIFFRKERMIGIGSLFIYALTVYAFTLFTSVDLSRYILNSLYMSPLRKVFNAKNDSFCDILLFLNSLMLRHHRISKN